MREGVPIGVIDIAEYRRDPELAELGDAVREPVDRDRPWDGIELQVALAAHLAEPGLALVGQPAAGLAAAALAFDREIRQQGAPEIRTVPSRVAAAAPHPPPDPLCSRSRARRRSRLRLVI